MAEQSNINVDVKDANYAATTGTGSAVIYVYNYYGYSEEVRTAPVKSAEVSPEDNLQCPYRGLFHFGPNDAEFFFGREAFVKDLVQATDTRNFIPVLGASGSGKSSVVLAGLVPKLQQEGHWKFTHFRPGVVRKRELRSIVDPFYALATAVVPLYTPQLDETEQLAQASKLADLLRNGEVLLSDAITKIQQNYPNHRVLLIADQFEEVYTICREEKIRRHFLDILIDNIHSPISQSQSSLVLVLTMRADFLGNALSYRPFADVLQKADIKLASMNRQELSQVIEKPAEKLRVKFEAGLVERILDDVEDEPGNLPLLEFALTLLWKRRTGKQLNHEAYEAIGRVKGALAKYADEKCSNLTPDQQEQARRIFIQLVRPGEGTEDTRRLATKDELGIDNWSLVQQLADDRLVVTNQNASGQETVEIVHEALIQNWDKFRTWMDKDRSFRTWQERLRVTMQQWEETKRDEGALLRGVVLAEAEKWLHKRYVELSLTEQEYIRQSLEQRERQKREEMEQRERQKREEILKEVEANVQMASNRLSRGHNLDALIPSLSAGIHLKKLTTVNTDDSKVVFTLMQTVYGIKEYKRLEGHDSGDVIAVAFSPNDELIVSGTRLNIIQFWKNDGSLKLVQGHLNDVETITFSPDGELIASASRDKTVKLWSLDGICQKTLEDHEDAVEAVAFSPDGELIASASSDRTIKLWKRDGTLQETFYGHRAEVIGVCFSPDGKTIASASRDRTVKLWSLNGICQKTLEGHKDAVYGVVFSPDGERIASSSWDKTVKIWRIDGTLQKTLKGHEDAVYEVVFSPDGKRIASCSWDKTVKIWSIDGTLQKTLKGHERAVEAVAFSHDGQMVVSGSKDKTVRVWKLEDISPKTLEGHEDAVYGVVFSPKGQTIATASKDSTVKLWSLDGICQKTLEGHKSSVLSVCFNPKGQIIATASKDSTVKLWSLDGICQKTLEGHEDAVEAVTFSPDGQTIASGSRDKTVKLWNCDGSLLNILQHEDEVKAVNFSPDGKLIATASSDKTVKLWKSDGTCLTTLKRHKESVLGVCFSPDSKTIATASKDETVKLWSIDGTLQESFPEHKDWVYSVVFSPDGKLIASASSDKTVKLWKSDGEYLATLEGHTLSVLGVCFSPDGKTIASAGRDKKVILWNFALDDLLVLGCNWMRDYLKTNPNVSESDRHLCDGIDTQK